MQLVTGVSIANALFETAGGGIIRAVSGQSVFLTNPTNTGTYVNDNNADTHVSGTVTNNGTMTFDSSGNLSRFFLDGNTTLAGGGTVTLTDTSNAQIAGGFTLTNVDNLIQGSGNIGANGVAFINQTSGIFAANAAGDVMFFDPSSGGFQNRGLIEATNGGIVQLSGNAGGSFDNTGAAITADGTNSEVQLTTGVSVTGGTLSASSGGLVHALGGQSVFLNNLTLSGSYLNDNNADTHVFGTIVNEGTMTFSSSGNLSRFVLDGDTTLTGSGRIILTDSSNGLNAQIAGGSILTNVNNTIQGFGNVGANGVQFINQAGGTFDANVSGKALFFDPNSGGFLNHGLLEATGGGLLQLSGNGGGSFTNTGAIISATGAASEVQLTSNATITGGTLSAANGGLIHALGGQSVFLSNLTLNGPYLNDNNADTHVQGTITNSGNVDS